MRYELPRQPTSFVGRTDDLATLAKLLADPDCRLLTLVGQGGIGKTRLALQAAEARAGVLSGGAVFVPLASVHESDTQGATDAVLAAIAESLGLAFHGGAEPLSQLLAFLRDKELLLLLDNMEHLLGFDRRHRRNPWQFAGRPSDGDLARTIAACAANGSIP